jgi:hypothetical protein
VKDSGGAMASDVQRKERMQLEDSTPEEYYSLGNDCGRAEPAGVLRARLAI